MPGCAPGEDGDDGAGGHANDYAYNLAVVVDDALTGVRQVVRGDDLLSSAPRQAYVAHLLVPPGGVCACPAGFGPEGKRLAKRDGAVTLRDLDSPAEALRWILDSLGMRWVWRQSTLTMRRIQGMEWIPQWIRDNADTRPIAPSESSPRRWKRSTRQSYRESRCGGTESLGRRTDLPDRNLPRAVVGLTLSL